MWEDSAYSSVTVIRKADRYRSSHMVKQKELVATWWKRSSNKQVLSRPCSSYLAR